MGEFMQGDSVTSTIEFDVLDATTREQITQGNKPSRPGYDLIQFPSGLGFQQDIDIVTGETMDYVIDQTLAKKTLKMIVCFKGVNAYAKLYSFNAWFAKYANHDNYVTRFSYEMNNIRRFVEVIATNGEPKEREGNYVTETLTLQPVSPFYEETTIQTIVNDLNEGMIYLHLSIQVRRRCLFRKQCHPKRFYEKNTAQSHHPRTYKHFPLCRNRKNQG